MLVQTLIAIGLIGVLPGAAPLLAGEPPTPAAPATAVAGASHRPDEEARHAQSLLCGTFIAEARRPEDALLWRASPVRVEGLSDTVYFEIARADRPAEPHRQGVAQVYRRQGQLRLRIFDIAGEADLKGALVGLWAAPESHPPLPMSALLPNLDLDLRAGAGAAEGRTPHPFPTLRDGATEMTSELRAAPGVIAIADRGFDAAGTQVWGPKPGEWLEFRAAEPGVKVVKAPSGLVLIDFVSPPESSGPALVEGGNIAVHYTGWRADGHRFETSRTEGRQPLRARIPGTGVRGVDEALLGMRPGTRRRAVIPPDLAFGAEGSVRGRIPPNATLIYDFEALEVQNPAAGRPPPPLPPIPPADR